MIHRQNILDNEQELQTIRDINKNRPEDARQIISPICFGHVSENENSALKSMASLLNAAGITLRGAGFVKMNMLISVMLPATHYCVFGFVASPMAVTLVDMMPVPVDKVPFLVIAALPIIAILCALISSAYAESNAALPRAALLPKP
jgi:hypothetical protein